MTQQKRQTLDQKRADHAWKCVQRVKQRPGSDDARKSFRVQIRKSPIRIVTAGLGHALAFLSAKGLAPDLTGALTEWIALRRPPAGEEKDLLARIVHGDSEFLRYATAESLAYLEWLVRFAEGEGLTASEENE